MPDCVVVAHTGWVFMMLLLGDELEMGPLGGGGGGPVGFWTGQIVFDFEVGDGAWDGEELVPECVDLVNGEEGPFVGFGFDEFFPQGVEVQGVCTFGGYGLHEACGAREGYHGRVHLEALGRVGAAEVHHGADLEEEVGLH